MVLTDEQRQAIAKKREEAIRRAAAYREREMVVFGLSGFFEATVSATISPFFQIFFYSDFHSFY